MRVVFSEAYEPKKDEILQLIKSFDTEGELLGKGNRNRIKTFALGNQRINIKSFKIPNALNKLVYRFFRKSKAERSFSFAQFLVSKNIGTPQPIAFFEKKSIFSFKESFYVSEHLDYNLTFRDLVQNPNYPNWEVILRAFTRFTFHLHENNIEFLDHSPGNTLIKTENGKYEFYLVDLNRMIFKKMNFEERMKNFSRLTPKKEMVKIMSNEYSHLIKKPEEEVFEKMWFFTNQFQRRFFRKKELKRKLMGSK